VLDEKLVILSVHPFLVDLI